MFKHSFRDRYRQLGKFAQQHKGRQRMRIEMAPFFRTHCVFGIKQRGIDIQYANVMKQRCNCDRSQIPRVHSVTTGKIDGHNQDRQAVLVGIGEFLARDHQ
ncbi:MAG: hypothetical protein WCA64_09275, partial [Gallionella sp.]